MEHLPRRLALIGMAILFTLTFGTIGFVVIEGYPVFEAFYMTLTTVTTVGYGEIRSLSHAGRIFNSFLISFGVVVIFLSVGGMTQTVIELELNQFFGKRRVKNMIEKLEGHYIVCGFGRLGRGAADELKGAGVPFVVIDKNEERVERAMKLGMLGVAADASVDETLRDVGIDRAKGLIATLASDADNLFLILSAKALNSRLHLSARVDAEASEQKMRRAGADFVFAPYYSTGHRMAQALLKPHVHQFINFATQDAGLDVNIEQVKVSTRSSFADRTLADVHVRRDLGVIILAVRKAAGEMLFNPPSEMKIAAGDYLIVMGEADHLQKLEQFAGGYGRMKVVTSAQMREADRRTIEQGISGDVLMARAGAKVVEFLESEFAPLALQRVVIFCGPGNNGGDGLVVGRLLKTRVANLQVVRAADTPGPVDRDATLVVDALLGTGFREPLEGRYAELIATINEQFPHAKVVAVDIPSAMQVRADFTVTFAAPKAEMLLDPRAGNAGNLIVADIGIPAEFLQSDLELSEPRDFAPLFQPRKRDANKGDYGHVLVVGGAVGKSGAAAMAGLAALRMGAGLVTVACVDSSRLAPELMTQPLDAINLERMTVLAIGPGLGMNRELVSRLTAQASIPTVIDADGLNSIAGTDFRGRGMETVLTPHPGEMGRLLGIKAGAKVAVRPEDRLTIARQFARDRNVCLVLKGFRTLIGFPDGRIWINPTGSPALAKGGSGDILTGLISGLIAQASEQLPRDIGLAVRAAVWLHGRAGELAAEELTEQCVLATDLLTYLPRAIREVI